MVDAYNTLVKGMLFLLISMTILFMTLTVIGETRYDHLVYEFNTTNVNNIVYVKKADVPNKLINELAESDIIDINNGKYISSEKLGEVINKIETSRNVKMFQEGSKVQYKANSPVRFGGHIPVVAPVVVPRY